MSSRNEAVISAQRARLEELLRPYLAPGAPYCLVDFPDHSNVGDSAIYVGELRLLGDISRRRPSYVCTYGSFDAERLRRACPEGPIFIHGGGNFGDVWPAHQAFRERVIALFPKRRIIQLPQSLHFQAAEAITQCARTIAGHSDFHLWVRDAASEAFARDHFDCQIQLAPDAAFALGPLARRAAVDVDMLLLLRTDVERRKHQAPSFDPRDAQIVDWIESDSPGRLERARTRLQAVLAGRLTRDARDEFKFEQLANRRVERGLRLLSRGRGVVTDRLHAHILCILLDIPHVVLDNVYGKIARYAAVWTHAYAAVRSASDIEEAVVELRRLQAELDRSAEPAPTAEAS